MQEIMRYAHENGFQPPEINLDGKVYRFDRRGHKNAWYVGWQHFGTASGEPYCVCIFGDWKTGEKCEFKPTAKLAPADKAIVKKRMDEAAKKAEEERSLKQLETAEKAERIVRNMKPIAWSEYLARKKITDLHGAGTILNEMCDRIIVVPMRDVDGKLWGVQRIFPDGEKRFLSGQKNSGTCHVIGNIDDDTLYLCEGFATGASIRQATGKTVVVCFNASNLVDVARALRKKYGDKSIVVCGDDDKANEANPGRKKAELAAKYAVGKTVFPVCSGTDFNDMHLEHGLDAVREAILGGKPVPSVGYIPLGFDGRSHFFFSKQCNSIKQINGFSNTDFYELMPRDYWSCKYAGENGAISWDLAKSDIVTLSNSVGIFDPFRIRGTGVWFDRNRTIINTGDAIICDGRPQKMGTLDSHYVYVATKNKMPPMHDSPLTVDECRPLLDSCERFKWRDDKSWVYLAGWIAMARIAGALPIRPHLWITGSSGTGKSTLMDKLVRPALGSESSRIYLQGGSTEAGIRQAVKADSLPILFDEFETTSEQTRERTLNLIELLRQAWSHTQGHVVKGSGSGVATHYALNFSALVSSIRIALDNDADRSRFTILELAPHGDDNSHWPGLKAAMEAIDEDYGERLFARMARMVPTVLASYRVASRVLADVINQRFGQQHGMLVAAWWALMSDSVMTEENARGLVGEMKFGDEKEDALETDERECLNHILTTRIGIQDGVGGRRERTIGQIIHDKNRAELDALQGYGILVELNEIFVANEHSALRKAVFERTRWVSCWRKSLARLPGAEPSNLRRSFGGKQSRCVRVPLAVLGLT